MLVPAAYDDVQGPIISMILIMKYCTLILLLRLIQEGLLSVMLFLKITGPYTFP